MALGSQPATGGPGILESAGRAAIIYQHATTEADVRIAATLESALAGDDDQADEDDPDDGDDGTAGALDPVR